MNPEHSHLPGFEVSQQQAGIGTSRMPAAAMLLGLALSVGGCAHAPAEVAAAPEPAVTLREPLPGLYTAGQPEATDWQAIRAKGVRTVVNLRTPGELQGRDEAAEVRAAGMRYVQIPVAGADGITPDNARALHAALAPAHGGGVLVHCASGNRAGALLGLEQAEFDGASKDDALALGRKAGMTSTEAKLRQVLGIGD